MTNPRSVIERARDEIIAARDVHRLQRGAQHPTPCHACEKWRDLAAELDSLLGAPELFSDPEQLPDDAALLNALYAILPFEMQMQLGGDAVEAREGLRQWPKGKVLLPSPREDVPEPYRAEPCPQCGAIRKVSGIPDAHFCAIKPEEPKR